MEAKVVWRAHCYYCDWGMTHYKGNLIEDAKQHLLEDGCLGPVILIDREGLSLPFPKTVLPFVVWKEVTTKNIGFERPALVCPSVGAS